MDYYNADTAWFHEALYDLGGKAGRGRWHDPVVLEGTEQQVIVYSRPICAGTCDLTTDPPSGVLSAWVSVDSLQQTVRDLTLTQGGEAFIVDRTGALVAHPRMDLVRWNTSVYGLAWAAGDAELGEAVTKLEMESSEGGEARAKNPKAHKPRIDPGSGRREFLLWEPISDSDGDITHILIAHVPGAKAVSSPQMRHWLVMRLAGAVPLVVLFGLLFSIFGVSDPERLAWIASVWSSLGAVTLIGTIWATAALHPTPPSPDDEPILSAADLAIFEQHWRDAAGGAKFVETGLFLQSIEFQSANNVTIAGLAWQRFPLEGASCEKRETEPPEEPRFYLPEADPGEEWQISLAYHRCDDEQYMEEVQGWRFRALLRQDFNYDLYPLDPQEIWVRLLPLEFDKNVVLVPDLIAYDRTARASLPGLDRDLILPGWDKDGSGFAFRRRAYNTNFGITNYVGQADFPELVYTVSLKRSFLGPFVGKVIPLGVSAAMLFCMLLLGTRKAKYEGAFGFTALEVVLGAAALFFVVIFDHSALRDDLATTRPFYLEYFYFVMYVCLVLVCMNAIAFAMGKGRPILFRDNLIPKVAFWPIVLGAIGVITTVMFWWVRTTSIRTPPTG